MKRITLLLLILLAGLLVASAAWAQQPLFTAPAGAIQSGNYATGMEFTTGTNPIYVTQLGYVDWNSSGTGYGDGLTDAGAQVGIWDMAGNLLASVTVPAGTDATLIGSYRYAALSSVLTLAANTTYQILGYGWGSPENKWLIWQNPPSTVDPYFGLSDLKTALHIGSFGNGDATWMTGNYTCGTANFIGTLTDPNAAYTITASAGAGGTISPTGSVIVANGGSQTFSITPSFAYAVADVLVDGVSVGAVTSYTFDGVTANHTISATFAALPTHTITASAGTGGTITPSGEVIVVDGTDQTFTIATAPGGYTIADVLVDGVSVGAVTTYTFTGVTTNHTISASFAAPPPHEQPMLWSRGTGAWRTDTFTIGTTFTTGADPVYVYKLGYVDQDLDGLANSHEVGIWQGSTLVGSVTVPVGTDGELIGDYRYAPVATITLAANTTYTLGAFAEGDAWPDSAPNPGFGVPDFSLFTIGQVGGDLRGACWDNSGAFSQPTNHWSNSGPGNVGASCNLIGTTEAATCVITASAGEGGIISPSGSVPVAVGGNQTFTITACWGYTVDQVLVDGVNNPEAVASGSYTFSNVTENHTIAVSFVSWLPVRNVSGKALDTMGNGVSGATVKAYDITSTLAPGVIAATTTTAGDGSYTLQLSDYGNYYLVATATSFDASDPLVVTPWEADVPNADLLLIKNLLLNGSFEVNSGNGSDPANWTATTNSYGAFDGHAGEDPGFLMKPVDGSWLLCAGADGAPGGRYQDVFLKSGYYELIIWAQNSVWSGGPGEAGAWIGSPGTDTLTLNDGSVFQTLVPAPKLQWTRTARVFRIASDGTYRLSLFCPEGSSVMIDKVAIAETTTPHTIDASVVGAGNITPSGVVYVADGQSQTFVFAPDEGSVIDQVLIDGVNDPDAVALGSYTFDNVTGDHTISVVFNSPVVGPVYGANNRSILTDDKLTGKRVKVWGNIQSLSPYVISDGYSTGVTINGTPTGSVGDMVVVTGIRNADGSVTP